MSLSIPLEAWSITIAIGVMVLSWVGVLLTAFTLPGIWLALVGAGLAQWWSWATFGSDQLMFSWWVLGVCVGLGVLAEIVELVASAFGAAKAGGSKKASLASVMGALVGALVGTFLIPVPVLGTILGAAGGAGLAALLTERHLGEKTWKAAGKVGAGAAAGRLVATLAKVGFAVVIATILSIDAFV
jgi:uncharacterized protein YqgC (DUF456 family)